MGGLFSLDNAGPDFWSLINSGKYQIMCINDGFNIQDEEQVMTDFIKAMDQLLPDRSSFEI
ncbi:receptor polysaccharide phosphotransferase WefC [Streptococcus sanguinis SK1056]|uniref:Receptor polysaccharide phosphotransferase WefC n=1 Tax=Streptococcus sanguinis SK1056 TaxID=888820 RepID=F3UDW2_STRSA|nr:receptor polysaccharide phosphotransferase WefC [Streptococcus sanguinis SK1056]